MLARLFDEGPVASGPMYGPDVGGPNDNHGGAVSEAARETCREAADEEPSDVEAEDTLEQDTSASGRGGGNGNGRGGGNGNGRGHGGGGRP